MNRTEFLKKLFLGAGAVLFFKPAASKPEDDRAQNYREISILKTFVAGYQYYEGEDVFSSPLENPILTLERNPENQFDRRAIMVKKEGKMIGYIPRRDNFVLSKLMDEGIFVSCMIYRFSPERPDYERLKVEVFMQIKS